MAGLRELELEGSFIDLPEELAACKQLTNLKMGYISIPSTLSSLECLRTLTIGVTDTPVYWNHLTGLTHLCLQMDDTSTYPEMAGMISLRRVEIHGFLALELPSSAYIRGVTNMSFKEYYSPRSIPAALEAAVQLRVLDLGDASVELSDSDLVLLSRLPLLETLYITKPSGVVQQRWDTSTALLMAKRTALGRTPLLLRDSQNN